MLLGSGGRQVKDWTVWPACAVPAPGPVRPSQRPGVRFRGQRDIQIGEDVQR